MAQAPSGRELAHDIRSALQTLQLQLEIILLDTQVSADTRAAAGHALSEIERISILADQVRNLS